MAETLRRLLALGILSLAVFPAAVLVAAIPEALAPGVKLLEAGHPEEARKIFAGYAAKNPGDADAALYLGRAYLALHKSSTAVEWLEKAAALAPASSDKQRWLGEGYGLQAEEASLFSAPGLAKKAKAAFDKAVALDPANLDAREDLIEFYLQVPGILGGSVDKAKEEAAEIRKRDSFRGRVAMAQVFLHQKDTAGAERELKAAVTESPADAKARLALGQLYANNQRWPEAFDSVEAILKTDPNNWLALYAIGRNGAVSGQHLDRAEECLKRYLGHTPALHEPPLANTHFRLGMVYEKKGDKAKARAEYQEAVRLDPKLEDAKKALEKVK